MPSIDEYGGWMMYSKFFDNMYPLPHHVHQSDEYAAHVGRVGKPEEVAAIVVMLASDGAGFVHGAHIDVNGGLFMD